MRCNRGNIHFLARGDKILKKVTAGEKREEVVYEEGIVIIYEA